jgi:ABC-type sugar transport system ATPase subunit
MLRADNHNSTPDPLSSGRHTTPILEFKGISRRFDAIQALDSVSFSIAPAEVHAIVGENGAGKSTLMKIVAGVIPHYDGKLLLNGQLARFQNTRDAQAAGIGIIHQELNLVQQLSVADNLFLGREITRARWLLNHSEMARKARQVLAPLDPSINPNAPIGTLRIGDQQLVEIARALALQPTVLVMDEPTSALSETEVNRLESVILALRNRGTTILYISHRMEEIFRFTDRITVLRDGRFIQTVDTKSSSPQHIAKLMVGRELPPRQPRKTTIPLRTCDIVLETRNLSLQNTSSPGRPRLQNINLQLRRTEILGLAGLMGAGRTELLECLAGASHAQPSGQILRNQKPAAFPNPAAAINAGIAMLTEDRKRLGIFPALSVQTNITLTALKSFATAGFISAPRESTATAQSIRQLGIKGHHSSTITSLSGGNQQKCLIARCLLTRPEILLLDDPTRGVDVAAKAEIHSLLRQLADEGLAILVTSSELPELLSLCDRILVLANGRITAEFNREQANEQAIIQAATGQLDTDHEPTASTRA